MQCFGYPHAHEDDAERAVRAGPALIEAVGKLQVQEPLQVRIGVATGLVVVGHLVGSGEAQERGVAGETPNLAARLQGLAAPNAVVIVEGARRLLGNLFELNQYRAELSDCNGTINRVFDRTLNIFSRWVVILEGYRVVGADSLSAGLPSGCNARQSLARNIGSTYATGLPTTAPYDYGVRKAGGSHMPTASDEVRMRIAHAITLLAPIGISDWREIWLSVTLGIHELEGALMLIRKQIP
jgi:hypothetical protein